MPLIIQSKIKEDIHLKTEKKIDAGFTSTLKIFREKERDRAIERKGAGDREREREKGREGRERNVVSPLSTTENARYPLLCLDRYPPARVVCLFARVSFNCVVCLQAPVHQQHDTLGLSVAPADLTGLKALRLQWEAGLLSLGL